jgi:hypothetical protein
MLANASTPPLPGRAGAGWSYLWPLWVALVVVAAMVLLAFMPTTPYANHGGPATAPTVFDAERLSTVKQRRVWLVCLVVLVGGLVTLGIFSSKTNYRQHGGPISPPFSPVSTPSR